MPLFFKSTHLIGGVIMAGLKFYRKRRRLNVDIIKKVLLWAVEIGIVVFLGVFVVMFFGRSTSIIGDSMSPTLEAGDSVLINKMSYIFKEPKRGDIIVFKPNGSKKSRYYIKRVVGIPGDKVIIKNGKIYINDEEYTDDFTEQRIENAGIAEMEITVGEKEYFVLGDNRNNGEDSRYANIGNVKLEYIEGRPWLKAAPLSHFGFI